MKSSFRFFSLHTYKIFCHCTFAPTLILILYRRWTLLCIYSTYQRRCYWWELSGMNWIIGIDRVFHISTFSFFSFFGASSCISGPERIIFQLKLIVFPILDGLGLNPESTNVTWRFLSLCWELHFLLFGLHSCSSRDHKNTNYIYRREWLIFHQSNPSSSSNQLQIPLPLCLLEMDFSPKRSNRVLRMQKHIRRRLLLLWSLVWG